MPVGWGIVGFGWVAQDFMVPAIAEAGDRLVAIADLDPGARARAEALGLRAYPNAAALAADPAVEAVYVATPNHRHAEAVEAVAAAGKAILCEKPMAASLADARRIDVACEAAGVLYGTAFDQRHHPAHRAMRDAIATGAIGIPTAIRIVYACWVGADWTDGSGRENWRVDAAKAGGGALIDLAPHGLDLIEFLLGEPIATISAAIQSRVQTYPVDDGAVLIGSTATGMLATLHVAYNCPEALPRRRLEVVGEAGMLVAENTMGQDPGGSLVHVDGRAGEARPIPFPASSPFAEQVRAFSQALRSGDHSAFSIDRDLHTMTLLHDAYANALPSPLRSGLWPEGGAGGGGLSGESPGGPPAYPPPRSSASLRLGPPGKGEGWCVPVEVAS